MARTPRPRHEVSLFTLTVMKPLLRYSPTRDAFVLRGIGNKAGPVLRLRSGRGIKEAS